LGRVRKGRGAFKGTHCRAPCLWAVVFCVFATGLTITLWQFYLPTICCFSSWNLRPGRHQPGARSQEPGTGSRRWRWRWRWNTVSGTDTGTQTKSESEFELESYRTCTSRVLPNRKEESGFQRKETLKCYFK